MRAAAISYLPSEADKRFGTLEFVENLAANRPAGDLILFSDHPQPTAERHGFKVIRLKGTVELESLKKATVVNPWTRHLELSRGAIPALVFLTAWRIAEAGWFTHFIMLEDDCRMKNRPIPTALQTHHEPLTPQHYWDTAIFSEFTASKQPLICAGSIVAYDPYNAGLEAALKFEKLVERTKKARKMPIPVYGTRPSSEHNSPVVFCNGAGACYSIEGLHLLFPERKQGGLDSVIAGSVYAYDWEIGVRGWLQFGVDWYNRIGVLPSIYSSYGNVMSSQAQRLQWLEEGKFQLIHQSKRNK